MAVKIQIKRGTKAGLPALSPGEYGLATDTGELFIGGANGNIQVATLGSDGKVPLEQLAGVLLSVSAAAEYSASATYSAGDYCVHEGQLYKANQDIDTAEAWTAAHWTATSIMAEIAALDYDPSGTAQSAVNTHNTSSTAHQDIRTALAAALTSEAVVSYN